MKYRLKRIIALTLAALLAFGTAGCSSSDITQVKDGVTDLVSGIDISAIEESVSGTIADISSFGENVSEVLEGIDLGAVQKSVTDAFSRAFDFSSIKDRVTLAISGTANVVSSETENIAEPSIAEAAEEEIANEEADSLSLTAVAAEETEAELSEEAIEEAREETKDEEADVPEEEVSKEAVLSGEVPEEESIEEAAAGISEDDDEALITVTPEDDEALTSSEISEESGEEAEALTAEEVSDEALTEVSEEAEEEISEAAGEEAQDETAVEASEEETAKTEEAAQNADESLSLPEAGTEIHGFITGETVDFSPKNAELVSFEHEKSGAKVLYIASGDSDKAVNIFLRTPSESDQGMPHILEHMILAGSSEYQNASLYDLIRQQTFSTYVDASTYRNATAYSVSSLSEDQLMSIMDFYMSSITDPAALMNDYAFAQEVYRYELYSPDGEIRVTGDMLDEISDTDADISKFAYERALKLLYPESIASFSSSGLREKLIGTSLEEVQAYYESYYHPSNMLIVLYGDLDPDAFLEKLDEDYLSKYERRDIDISDDDYIPWEGYRKAVVDFPVSEESITDGAGTVIYAISLGEMDMYERKLISVLALMLSSEESPLRKAVEAEFPGAVFTCTPDVSSIYPSFIFSLEGSDYGDSDKFRTVVDDALSHITEEGWSADLTYAVINQLKMKELLQASEPGGMDVSTLFGLFWAVSNDMLSYTEYTEALRKLSEEAEKGTFEAMTEMYLYGPAESVLLEVNPVAGLLEELEGKRADALSSMKASLSKEELADLIGDTCAYEVWKEADEEEAKEFLGGIMLTDTSKLPETYRETEVSEGEIDGVKSLTSLIEGAGYLSTDIYLDAAFLDFDEIHDFVFLGELLGSLDTANYTYDSLHTQTSVHMYDFQISPHIVYDDTDGPHPYLDLHFMALDDHITEAGKLLKEIVSDTDFSDTGRIRDLASKAAYSLQSLFTDSPFALALETAGAAADQSLGYEYYALYLDYLSYLTDLSSMSDDEAEDLSSRFDEVLAKLRNRSNMIYTAVGDDETLEKGEEVLSDLMEVLSDENPSAADYSEELAALELPEKIAFITDTDLSCHIIAASDETLGISHADGADLVAASYIYSHILQPAFSIAAEASSVLQGLGDHFFYVTIFGDLPADETFLIYESIPEMIAETDIAVDDLRYSVLEVLNELMYPSSPLTLAEKEIEYRLRGRDTSYSEERVSLSEQAKEVTPEYVYSFADVYGALVNDGAIVSVMNSDAASQSSISYDIMSQALID